MKDKLTNICDFQGGSQPPKAEWSLKNEEGYIRMLQIRDFTQSERVTPEFIKLTSTTKTCENDDILIARYGASIGKILTGLSGAYNVAIMKTIPDTTKITKKYLYYFLKSPYFQNSIINVGSRAAQAGFNKEDLAKLDINCPNIDEQNDIICILEKVEKIIANRNQQLLDLDNLIKSRFVEIFGDLAINQYNWKESQLIDLCSHKDDIKCGPFGTQLSKDEYKKDGVPLWGIPQINSFFTIMPTDYLSEEKAKKLEAYSIINGDIVMSRKGNVGKCAIYPDDLPIGIMHSDALRIRINPEEMNSNFLMHQLHNSRYVVNQIENVSSGAIMAGVNVTKLKTISVHIPPINLQNEFETFVQQVDNLKVEMKKSLDESQILFDSLMQKYFE